jgi:hypothetical protein
MWGEQTATKMLGDAGFTSIEVARVDGDIVNSYIIASRLCGRQSFMRW